MKNLQTVLFLLLCALLPLPVLAEAGKNRPAATITASFEDVAARVSSAITAGTRN